MSRYAEHTSFIDLEVRMLTVWLEDDGAYTIYDREHAQPGMPCLRIQDGALPEFIKGLVECARLKDYVEPITIPGRFSVMKDESEY